MFTHTSIITVFLAALVSHASAADKKRSEPKLELPKHYEPKSNPSNAATCKICDKTPKSSWLFGNLLRHCNVCGNTICSDKSCGKEFVVVDFRKHKTIVCKTCYQKKKKNRLKKGETCKYWLCKCTMCSAVRQLRRQDRNRNEKQAKVYLDRIELQMKKAQKARLRKQKKSRKGSLSSSSSESSVEYNKRNQKIIDDRFPQPKVSKGTPPGWNDWNLRTNAKNG